MTSHPTGADNSADGFGAIEALPRAYRIADVCKATGLGRTSVYEAIRSGELTARRWHRCTIVLAEDLEAFLRNLPTT
jgi:hypothetical protein